MSLRWILGGICLMGCLALAKVASDQRQELSWLRGTLEHSASGAAEPSASQPQAATNDAVASESGPPLELLKLRSEVGRLMNQRRELGSVTNENARLRAEAEQAAGKPVVTLPEGYILRKNARWLGQDTPEHAIESLCWAIENRDVDRLMNILPQREAERIRQEIAKKGADFMKEAMVIPGLRILSRQDNPDGSVEMQVEIVPGIPEQEMPKMRMKQVNGEWRLAE